MDFINEGEQDDINESLLNQPIIYSDHLLEQILELEVPIEYTVQSGDAFVDFSNISNMTILDIELDQQREDLWIGNTDGNISVVNHTLYAVDNLEDMKVSPTEETVEYVFGFSKQSLDTLVTKWEKQCN